MRLIPVLCACMLALPVVGSAHAETHEQLAQQVRDAENGFAATMAKRDHKAFATFIAEDAVFFGGENRAYRGKKAVVDSWKGLYEKPDAPFVALRIRRGHRMGKLAHSSGPVVYPKGERMGTFNSVWRRESDGSWKVVFDKGCDACDCAKPAQ